jgi:hypothetical protein
MPTNHIALTPCESSNIAAHGYDASTKTLAIQFKGSGSIYHYHDVPADVAHELGNAESVGRFFGQHIRPKFKHTAVQTAA